MKKLLTILFLLPIIAQSQIIDTVVFRFNNGDIKYFMVRQPSTAGTVNIYSTSNQIVNAASTALLIGSVVSIPATKLQVGTVFKYTISLSKTAAGTAANTFLFKLGVNGTVADPTILTFTTGAGTAAIDAGRIDIIITIRGPLSTLCTAQGNFRLTHELATTGLITKAANIINITSGVFDATTNNLKASLVCVTGASNVLTFQQVVVEAINL